MINRQYFLPKLGENVPGKVTMKCLKFSSVKHNTSHNSQAHKFTSLLRFATSLRRIQEPVKCRKWPRVLILLVGSLMCKQIGTGRQSTVRIIVDGIATS